MTDSRTTFIPPKGSLFNTIATRVCVQRLRWCPDAPSQLHITDLHTAEDIITDIANHLDARHGGSSATADWLRAHLIPAP